MKRTATPDAPPSPAESSESPTSSSADLHPCGPPRKRARGETTVEERREARAHRNRIAAQNSRDRRKAQFVFLESRVAELEEENRQLRAGMGLAGLRRAEDSKTEEHERDRAREKENEELKARIKTLETGWDAVVKALAASGLPLSLPSPISATPSTSIPPPDPSASSQPPTTTFPVLIPPSPVFPLSPAASHSSSSLSPLFDFDLDEFVPTRHLARVATTDVPPLSSSNLLQLQLALDAAGYPSSAFPDQTAPSPDVDEVVMENLLREILAPSPTVQAAPLPAGPLPPPATAHLQSQPEHKVACAPAAAPSAASTLSAAVDWQSDEMQRLLDMLPSVQPDGNADGFTSALDMELCGWDGMGDAGALGPSSEVGVF
ncbi:hypothetical protein B0H21DRAFT_843272 [Amylocystis lapponica]|nr:hypothetical protein B0H21DRAFT_843272 [Amylocystis lapponica]